jgi:hypothetical protein
MVGGLAAAVLALALRLLGAVIGTRMGRATSGWPVATVLAASLAPLVAAAPLSRKRISARGSPTPRARA